MAQEHPVQFRSGALEVEFEIRGDSVGLTAKRDLERYYGVLALSLPKFSEAEACLICDSCNGWYIPEGSTNYVLLWANVADSIKLNHYDEKWGVDGEALVQKLHDLKPAECLALIDAVERFWRLPDMEMADAMKEVGLLEKEMNRGSA